MFLVMSFGWPRIKALLKAGNWPALSVKVNGPLTVVVSFVSQLTYTTTLLALYSKIVMLTVFLVV